MRRTPNAGRSTSSTTPTTPRTRNTRPGTAARTTGTASRARRATPKEALADDLARVKRILAVAVAASRQPNETQTAFALRIGDAPSQLSLVETHKLRGISTERLLAMLAAAGRTVTITVGRAQRAPGRIVVGRNV